MAEPRNNSVPENKRSGSSKVTHLTAGAQPRWIQGIRRGDGFGDQDTIELKIKEWLNKYSSVRKYSGEKRLNNLAYVKS